MRTPFQKSIGGMTLTHEAHPGNDWLDIDVRVGHRTETITLHSDEEVVDLHYALGRYLEHIKEKPNA